MPRDRAPLGDGSLDRDVIDDPDLSRELLSPAGADLEAEGGDPDLLLALLGPRDRPEGTDRDVGLLGLDTGGSDLVYQRPPDLSERRVLDPPSVTDGADLQVEGRLDVEPLLLSILRTVDRPLSPGEGRLIADEGSFFVLACSLGHCERTAL